MQTDTIQEARRQAEICNACRYCEGYCAVFPALHANRQFSDGAIVQLANLCHNCRGCYYACQYTAPHEFDLNLPRALADVRQESWEDYAWPQPLARRFHRSGLSFAMAIVAGFTAIFALIVAIPGGEGTGFYTVLSHGAMVAIFAPAFLFPFFSLGVSLRRYWRAIGGGRIRMSHVIHGLSQAATLKNLNGGHGLGCNFEDEDRFSQARRHAHQAVVWGFGLCFLSTASATVMHYVLAMPAPYGLLSLPKLFGLPGGVLMGVGTAMLAALKLRADRSLGSRSAWGGEMAFVALLFLIAATGLMLYGLGATAAMPTLLVLHLGAVLAFFLLTPYTKMAHAFYRLAALIRDASRIP